jgi:hypothetical protein
MLSSNRLHGLHLHSAFLSRGHSKRFSILPNIHSSGEVRVRCLAQGHLDARLGGAGYQTSNLPVTSQPPKILAIMVYSPNKK